MVLIVNFASVFNHYFEAQDILETLIHHLKGCCF
jgi:hypothetical protein